MLAVLEQLPILQDALIGATLGTMVGNTVAARRGGHLQGAKASRLVLRWTWTGTGFGLAAHLLAHVFFGA